MRPQKIFIILAVIVLILVAVVFWITQKAYQPPKGEVLISTDKTEYEKQEIVRVKIKNDFKKQICFSSCYPYYLERKNENWESYQYIECDELDGNGSCIGAKEEKAFELTLPEVPAGLHRLTIPVCLGCKKEDPFKEDARFYSNEFLAKEVED